MNTDEGMNDSPVDDDETDGLHAAIIALDRAMPDASDEEIAQLLIEKFPELIEEHREQLRIAGLESLIQKYIREHGLGLE